MPYSQVLYPRLTYVGSELLAQPVPGRYKKTLDKYNCSFFRVLVWFSEVYTQSYFCAFAITAISEAVMIHAKGWLYAELTTRPGKRCVLACPQLEIRPYMLITKGANTLGQTRRYQEEDVNFLGNSYLKMPAITEGLLNIPYLLSCFLHREILEVSIRLNEIYLQFLNIKFASYF